jgi:hypothetical protein
VTPAQRAAYHLYASTPEERITTHLRESEWQRRRVRQRVARHWNQKKFWGKRGG